MTEHPMTEATPLASEQITRDMIADIIAAHVSGPTFRDVDLRLAHRDDQLTAADAILAALSASPAPVGWKLVPVEPTREMRKAGETEMMARHTNLDCFNDPYVDSTWDAMLAASPAPSGQGVSGEVARCKTCGERMDSEGIPCPDCAFSARLAPAPSCAPGEVERAKLLWERACVGREGYCSSDLQDAAIEAIKQAFREAEAAARSATLPAHFQWSESNREKFDFGRDSAADAIAALSPQGLDARHPCGCEADPVDGLDYVCDRHLREGGSPLETQGLDAKEGRE